MPRLPNERAMKKMTVRLYVDDLDVLKQYYPAAGYNQVIRKLVSRHVRQLEERTTQKLQLEGDQEHDRGSADRGDSSSLS